MTPRSVPEWVGKTADTKVPDHVRLRIFRTHEGRCHISRRKIMPSDHWELEHVIPLSMGGEHRERNLAPALADKHKEKSKQEAADRARGDAASKHHLGIRPPSRLRSAGFVKAPPQRSASRPITRNSPRPQSFGDTMTDTVGDALPREMARVRDVVMPPYIEIGPAGQFALALMRHDLDIAAKAMAEGDVVAMIGALQELKGWQL